MGHPTCVRSIEQMTAPSPAQERAQRSTATRRANVAQRRLRSAADSFASHKPGGDGTMYALLDEQLCDAAESYAKAMIEFRAAHGKAAR